MNRRTIEDLQDVLRDDPEAGLHDVFPKDYARRMRIAGGPSTALVDKSETPILRDFRERSWTTAESPPFCFSCPAK